MKVFFVLISLCLSMPVLADPVEDQRPQDIEFQKIKAGCWALSDKHRASPDPYQQDKGTRITANCMRDNIIQMIEPLFSNKKEFRNTFLEPLDQSAKAYRKSLGVLHFGHDKCPEDCGLYGMLFVSHSMVEFYEPILKDAISQNWRYLRKE